MSFDYCFAYEDRGYIHTSRWTMHDVDTKVSGNTLLGRLWLVCQANGITVTTQMYQDPDCESGDLVASGTADISGIDSQPARCSLSQENSSGLSGEFYFETYAGDPESAAEVVISLCTDSDLQDEHANLDDLPVYDSETGLARYCSLASRKILLLVSQMYAEELGGYGAPEQRYRTSASREEPDFRRLANVDQLKDAAVHWALMLAFGACHERAEDTMYSQLRDYHDTKRQEAIAVWNLAFNTNPDTDEDADRAKSSGMVRVARL